MTAHRIDATARLCLCSFPSCLYLCLCWCLCSYHAQLPSASMEACITQDRAVIHTAYVEASQLVPCFDSPPALAPCIELIWSLAVLLASCLLHLMSLFAEAEPDFHRQPTREAL
ncbi:hypothetical protein V8C35DRAFT_312528, partial [Trichoderma chlorosporum]